MYVAQMSKQKNWYVRCHVCMQQGVYSFANVRRRAVSPEKTQQEEGMGRRCGKTYCKKGEKTVQHTKDVIKQGRKLMSTEGAVGA